MDKWHACKLHRIGKACLETAAENLQACAKRDVERRNPGEYRRHRNGNKQYYEREALGSTELPVCLVGARLRKVRI